MGKTPYVRFDLNDYSVPHTHVRRTLAVLADEQRVRILDGASELARHRRSCDRDAQIEDDAHVQRAGRPQARQPAQHRACDRAGAGRAGGQPCCCSAPPSAATTSARSPLRCCACSQRWGAAALQAAIVEALARDVPHPNAVRLALERAREAAGRPPPVALVLPEHVARRDAPVRPHALGSYDRTTTTPRRVPMN